MPRKPVRGRYLIVVPIDGGGRLTIDTHPSRSLTPAEIVAALRKHADHIERFFVSPARPQ